jgi:hypothetical protein
MGNITGELLDSPVVVQVTFYKTPEQWIKCVDSLVIV